MIVGKIVDLVCIQQSGRLFLYPNQLVFSHWNWYFIFVGTTRPYDKMKCIWYTSRKRPPYIFPDSAFLRHLEPGVEESIILLLGMIIIIFLKWWYPSRVRSFFLTWIQSVDSIKMWKWRLGLSFDLDYMDWQLFSTCVSLPVPRKEQKPRINETTYPKKYKVT